MGISLWRGFISALLLASTGRAADAILTAETTTFELCTYCPAPQIRVLTTPSERAKIDAADQPLVVQVLFNGQRDDGKAEAFTAKWVPAAQGTAPRAIEITYRGAPVLLAGSYDMFLDLQPKATPPVPRLKITVVRPAPKLSLNPKLVIEQTRWLPFLDIGMEESRSEQWFDETSRKAEVTGISVRRVAPAALGTKLVTGSLDFDSDGQKRVVTLTDKERRKPAEYKTKGDFPLGTTTGSMKVLANETTEPLATFDFEVRKAASRLYLIILLMLGLLASWWVKVRLQQSIERDQAFLDGDTVRARVVREAARHQDDPFQAAFAGQLTALREALREADAAGINTAKLALDDAFKKALDELAKRRLPISDQYEKLDRVLQTISGLDLPLQWKTALEAVRSKHREAKKLLEEDRLDVVKKECEDALDGLKKGLAESVKLWEPKLTQTLDVFAQNARGMPATLVAAAVERAVVVRQALTKIGDPALLLTADDAQQAAINLHAARNLARQFFADLAVNHAMALAGARIQIEIAHSAGWHEELFTPVEQAGQALEKRMDLLMDDPDPVALNEALLESHRRWYEGLTGQFQKKDNELDGLIDAAKYLEGLKHTLQKLKEAEEREVEDDREGDELRSSVLRKTAKGGTQETERALRYAWREIWPGSQITVLHLEQGRPPELPVVSATEVTRRLWRKKLWQTLGVGSIAALAGYGLFSPAWVGTFADCSTAFFWAFGLDLTLEAVLKVVKKP